MKSEKSPFFSIAIPFYYKDEISFNQLLRCVNSVETQTFRDFEIIISTQNVFLRLKEYFLNSDSNIKIIDAELIGGFIQGNINNAIKYCSGKWIKILFSDDFFKDPFSLENLLFELKKNPSFNWGIANSLHFDAKSSKISRPIIPYFQKNILEINTIGSPSTILIKNNAPILFDEKTWMRLDTDYYYSLYKKYGKPIYFKDVFIVNEIHNNQFSSLLRNQRKLISTKLNQEINYLCKKYQYKKIHIVNYFICKLFIKIERYLLNIIYYLFMKKFMYIIKFLEIYFYSRIR
ncbi:glycosyltransferase [uncultured Prochlorococcus sp.]|uniref:glycosyltransferase family 2 protein n=1 Tax=uncultured Prochlorococcus sp. TaxID=159733 RepID=UPI00259046FC|nr:glycosyltransferase [uncultured Prochlorococcus sp.]